MTRRIVVIGTSCVGKSSFASRLGALASLPHIELDRLFWGPNWTPSTKEAFRAQVLNATVGERWIVDGDYEIARDVLWPLATQVIWLNYSLSTTLARGIRRTLKRALSGERLWNGNVESLRRSYFSRDSVLLWILATHAQRAREYAALRSSKGYRSMEWVEFVSPGDADAYLATLERSASGYGSRLECAKPGHTGR